MDNGIEGYFVSKALEFKKRRYSTGLFSHKGILINDEWISVINSYGVIKSCQYSMKTKEVRIAKRNENPTDTFSLNSQNYAVIDLNEDGTRWEGIVVNGHPCGYGSLYNNESELLYRGVMIGNKRECFGIDFYPGLDKIEYIGCYWNNERHGFGMLYDRKGELLYEGDYMFGSSYNQKKNNGLNETVRVNDIDDPGVHSLIRELIVGKGCDCGHHKVGELSSFPFLESVVIENDSLRSLYSLEIRDLPNLTTFTTGHESFYETTRLSLSSLMIYD